MNETIPMIRRDRFSFPNRGLINCNEYARLLKSIGLLTDALCKKGVNIHAS